MKTRTMTEQVRSGRLGLMVRVGRILVPFYRLAFLSSASTSGVLMRLKAGPVPREALMEQLGVKPGGRDAFESWLDVGVGLKVLGETARGLTLRGTLARLLVDPRHDPVLALVQEFTTLHHRLILETPARAMSGELFGLQDQDGELIARSSRVLEPFLAEEVVRQVPASGTCRLLEVGCGSGTYVRHAARRNPELRAVALELQPDVAQRARENLERWGLVDRVQVRVCDVRDFDSEERFDLVTLHQNIYYFPREQRPELLRRVSSFLAPGGRLLLTTGCSGGSVALGVLDLWAAATEGCGRLPARSEMIDLLGDAGLSQVTSRRLVPGEAVFAFTGIAAVPGG